MEKLVEKLSALSGMWESSSRSLTFTTDALIDAEVCYGSNSRKLATRLNRNNSYF